jgi:tryptophanase
MELLRLAFPKRVFTLSQVKYVADRLAWLHHNRQLIGGLEFVEEPRVLRFFFGMLKPTGDWPNKLMKKFREDFGESLYTGEASLAPTRRRGLSLKQNTIPDP